MRVLRISLVFVFGLASLTVFGQGLADHPDYQKAIEFQILAQQALEEGNYDEAYEYASQAEYYALKLKAGFLIDKLEDRLSSDKGLTIAKKYPTEYEAVVTGLQEAKDYYNIEDYKKSIEQTQKSQADLDTLEKLLARETTIIPSETGEKLVLPKYYVVRLIPENRDCLWNIAGYPFVYNDPTKWPLLYKANKTKLPQPANPHLILPEMVLVIPALGSEIREGTYDPSKTYPAFPKKK